MRAIRAALARPMAGSSDFDLNPDYRPPADLVLRPAAVLVPLLMRGDELRLILTKRSSRLKHHPGQIAFPGGKVDPGDAGPQAAALREAWEEIGLDPGNVDVLGRLPDHRTVTTFAMTPFLGQVRDAFAYRAEPGEVAEVFELPLAHVLNPANFSIEHRRWRGVTRRYYTVPYGPYYIWGATACVLHGLARRLVP
ncbi:phosphohydrolase [Defluviimonas sp. 20V17]|nr:phosphohydrolase [Defluviimonas sp. 20V17]